MTESMCHTLDVAAAYKPSDRLQAAVKGVEEAEAAKAEAMSDLYDAIAAEVAMPNLPADVGRFLGYHAGHVRRIARERGVAPHRDVEPPSRSKS